MPFLKKLIAVGGLLCLTSGAAMAAKCGNTSAGFDAWKSDFAKQAQRSGVGERGLQALAAARYSQTTINADRNQKSFRYTLAKFMQIRGSATIEAQGHKRLAKNPLFYQSLEKRYGVPAGVLLAIHGMETGSAASWATRQSSRRLPHWRTTAAGLISSSPTQLAR